MHSDSLRFGGYLKTRWASPRRIRFWLLVLVILYTLLGFLGLPWVVRYIAVNTAQEDFGRELRIEAVHANPYTLTLQIDGLALHDIDDEQLLGWERLFIDLAWSSVVSGSLTFQTIHLDKPIIQEERFATGKTRLSRLAPERSDKAPAEAEPTPLPALQVNDLRVTGAVLRFADNLQDATTGQQQRVSLALQNVDLAVNDFSLQEGARFPLRLDGKLAGGGELAFDGRLQLLPTPALEGEARIDDLALMQAEPYLRQFTDLRLDSGTINLNGQIQSDAQQPFAFHGAFGIDALNVRKDSDDESLIGWQSVQIEQLDLRLAERQIKSTRIAVDGLTGRVIIHEDRTTNFGQLVAKPPTDDTVNNDHNAPTDDTDEQPAPFAITIEGIALSDGGLRFADYSLPLPFATSIHSLNGQISTLSSTSAQPARIELEGQVAEYGLARVDGAIHAWYPMRGTDLQVTFRNLEIPEYSPYTVDFAGHKIAEGSMDLDLDYTITDQQLDGRNNLVLRDLKLGDKMAASNAMDLPLGLAIALLQDSDGIIDLDLPISGNVGDPKFDIGQVIRGALGSSITSVVQAPFSLLAKLVGADSSEDLSQVDFSAGRSDLLPPQRARIAMLREALNQRPALALELPGSFSRTFDGPALQREKAIAALRQRLAETGRDVEDLSLTTESSQGIVEAMFTTHYPDLELTTVRAPFTERQDEATKETGFDALAYRNHLAEQVIAAQSLTDAEFEAIANARAAAVRDALVETNVNTRIAADRVRLLDPKEVDSVDGERIVMEVGITAD